MLSAPRLSLALWGPPVLALACLVDLAGARVELLPSSALAALVALIVAAGALHGLGVRALTLLPWPQLVIESARRLTDVDLDGHSSLLAGDDCAPFDREVFPGAAEIAGNGIDDNCLLGDAAAPGPRAQRITGPQRPAPLDVVLITIDSLRADRVGAYCAACGEHGRNTTPNLDAFAREATVFERAYTPGGWTSIAVSALMRGLYARRLEWTE